MGHIGEKLSRGRRHSKLFLFIAAGTDVEGAFLRFQKREDQPQHRGFALAGGPHEGNDLMRIGFQRSAGKDFCAGAVGVVEILHDEADALLPVLFSKLFHGAVLTVVLLGHFHDIHETTRGDRQGDGRGNQAGQGVHGAGQRAGEGEKHGHGSVADGIAPDAVNAPAVAAVGDDEADDGHQDGGEDGHFLEIQPHPDVFRLETFQAIGVKTDQVKGLDGLNVGESLLVETVHFRIHGRALLVVVPHPAKQRPGEQGAEGNA